LKDDFCFIDLANTCAAKPDHVLSIIGFLCVWEPPRSIEGGQSIAVFPLK
jgi:hypothetical protein